MLIHEYQAKEILKKYNIPVPAGRVAESPAEAKKTASEIGKKVAVKAQVHVGGRGKAGGIKLAKTSEEAEKVSSQILGMNLKGLTVRKVLIEEALSIKHEFYLGITVDRTEGCNTFMISPMGGVDIEEVVEKTPEKILKVAIDPSFGLMDYHVRIISHFVDIDAGARKSLSGIIKSLYEVFISTDANLAEINPLVLTDKGTWIAADAKINIDDNALFRHAELQLLAEIAEEDPIEREAHKRGLAYVRLDGDVGIIGNGAGLVMCSLDMAARAGGRPADFLDIGGGAKADVVKNSLEVVLSDPNVKGVFFNIFGGITRGDEVAKGIIDVISEMKIKVPMVIRLSGTRAEEGHALLKEANLISVSTMKEGAEKIVEVINK